MKPRVSIELSSESSSLRPRRRHPTMPKCNNERNGKDFVGGVLATAASAFYFVYGNVRLWHGIFALVLGEPERKWKQGCSEACYI